LWPYVVTNKEPHMQHDAHCYIAQDTWQRPAKGKKRVRVVVPRKISRVTTLGGIPALLLETPGFVKHCLYRHELAQGCFRIVKI
jgi:hypothetical protein